MLPALDEEVESSGCELPGVVTLSWWGAQRALTASPGSSWLSHMVSYPSKRDKTSKAQSFRPEAMLFWTKGIFEGLFWLQEADPLKFPQGGSLLQGLACEGTADTWAPAGQEPWRASVPPASFCSTCPAADLTAVLCSVPGGASASSPCLPFLFLPASGNWVPGLSPQ